MLRNYLRVALRNVRRNLGYTTLNVVGLAAGLTCVLLIGLWIQNELSYDSFHADADRTYRIVREWNLPQLQSAIDNTPPSLAPNQPVPDVLAGSIALLVATTAVSYQAWTAARTNPVRALRA